MRRRTIAALGAGATATAATGVLLATGILTTSLAILIAPVVTLPAAAEELTAFDDCEELRQWYVDSTLPRVTAWGLDGWPGAYGAMELDLARSSAGEAVPGAAAGAVSKDAVGNGDTGTNVQEAGVDEPDVAKTDGNVVVHVNGNRLVITDVSGDEPRELSRIAMPRRVYDPEILLLGDTVLAVGTTSSYGGPVIMDQGVGRIAGPGSFMPSRSTTVMSSIDISDPSAPRIERTESIDGHLVSARAYDGTVRVVVSTPTPDLPFVTPDARTTEAEARAANRQVVMDAAIDAWLPSSRVHLSGAAGQGRRVQLLDCTDVRHPEKQSGLGTISILTFDAQSIGTQSDGDRSSTAITAGGELVYSSSDRLYVATNDYGWSEPIPFVDKGQSLSPEQSSPELTSPGQLKPEELPAPTTEVHAFAITGADTTYVASGEVRGTVRDRWSFSEHDGNLRVATALGQDSWNPRENGVFVLEERGNDLVTVGSVDGIGPEEQIQSVRWFGDVAVVVTFRQVDPLYTIDLSDPTNPRVLGELKIPGFSSYLHPIGGDLLLGIGQDATKSGQTTGAQASTFDIGDLSDPTRLDTEEFPTNTELATAWDPRAFTYLPERRIALSPLQSYLTGETRMAILAIDEDGTITRTTTETMRGLNFGAVRALPLEDGRVAVVSGQDVTLLSLD